MEFLIADTFTNSLARLNNQEQRAVKTTAFDLQLDPANPGMQFHRVDRSKDPNFWSVRVNRDVRIIVHKTASSFLVCYAGHHDNAYAWAERRKIERHPKTGAAQSLVDAWQVTSWEAYRDTPRLGRKTRLGEQQRQELWNLFAAVRAELKERGLLTWPELYGRVTERLKGSDETLFDFVVVDEAQDVSVPELRFLAALGSKRTNGLFFTADLGQRIFQQPFSWSSLGIDVKGRSYTLRVNYRTSQQIRRQADRLLPQSISDVDGIEETRGETISLLNGPPPIIRICNDFASETNEVSNWLKARMAENIAPHEIGVFVRSDDQMPRAWEAINAAGLTAVELTENIISKPDHVSLGTMHMAKGLEFRGVAIMACDDDILPLQERIESVSDPSDLEEVYNTERHLLYVACTRARDHLLITAVEPASEFLDDFGSILIG